MHWRLIQRVGPNSEGRIKHDLEGPVVDILRDTSNNALIIKSEERTSTTNTISLLARISIGRWGVKLKPGADEDISVIPAYPREDITSLPRSEEYRLSNPEIVFLRESDTIRFDSTASYLTLVRDANEIQVTSSAITSGEEVPESFEEVEFPTMQASAQSQQSITKWNVESEVIIAQSNPQRSFQAAHSTPLPSVGEVVEETPTTHRIQPEPIETASSNLNGMAESADLVTPNGEPPVETEGEVFSTAPSKTAPSTVPPSDGVLDDEDSPNEDPSSFIESKDLPMTDLTPEDIPQARMLDGDDTTEGAGEDKASVTPRLGARELDGVHIYMTSRTPSKRATPTDEEEDVTSNHHSSPARKKAKTVKHDSQDSRLSNIEVDTTQIRPAKKSKRGRPATKHATPRAQPTKKEAGSAKSTRRVSMRTSPKSSPTNEQDTQGTVAEEDLYQEDQPAKVVFLSNSTVGDKASFKKFLKEHGGAAMDSVQEGETNILCIGNGFTKSAKLLLSVVLGIHIVNDQWLIDSSRAGRLLHPGNFVPEVPDQEQQWGFSMENVIGQPRRQLLKGKTVYFTPALKKEYKNGFKEIEDIAKKVGAEEVISKISRNLDADDDTIILGSDKGGDLDAATLLEHGHRCFSKDLLSTSILRGRLDLKSSEFALVPSSSEPKKSKKKRNS